MFSDLDWPLKSKRVARVWKKNQLSFLLTYVKPKLHLYDLLWICCTTSCTTNPQQIRNILTCQDVVDLLWTLQQIHNKSN